MTRPRLTVAEVIRSCLDEFLEQSGSELTPEQRRALNDLISCRTAALGGHVLGCPECGHQQIAYNSCGNRHCPTCQATAAARWLEARAAELLPVPYFHLVFTLPDALNAKGQPFKIQGIYASLKQGGPYSAEALGQRVVKGVEAHASGHRQYDDITLLSFGRVR